MSTPTNDPYTQPTGYGPGGYAPSGEPGPGGYGQSPQPGYGPQGYSQIQSPYGQHPGYGGHSPTNLSSRWKRLGAAIIDALAIGVVTTLITLVLGGGNAIAGSAVGANTEAFSSIPTLVATLAGLGLAALNQIIGFGERGRTLGKMALGMRVRDVNTQQPMDQNSAVVRFAVHSLPGVVPFIGSIFSIVDACFIFRDDKRTIHDLAAKTIVVDA